MQKNNKSSIQKLIVSKIFKYSGHGIIALATGVGKTKIAIEYLVQEEKKKILWIVPKQSHRDDTIRDEFEKWGYLDYYNKHVETICYKSIHKLFNNYYDQIILDEGHNITELNSTFFDQNHCESVLMLTATVPTEPEKVDIINHLKLEIIHSISVSEAEKLGLISPYEIILYPCKLDRYSQDSLAGSKNKRFYTTEYKNYEYITGTINKLKALNKDVPFYLYLKRMHIIHNLKSKLRAATEILNNIHKSKRVLVFCSNIKQAEALGIPTFHSKTDKTNYYKFNNKEINRLAVVKAINEGDNMTDVDIALIVQVDSKSRNYIQRQGRALRWRKGHESKIIVIYSENTVDENWVIKSIKELDKEIIIVK